MKVEWRTSSRVRELQIGGMQKLTWGTARQIGGPRSVRTAEPSLAPRGVRGVAHNWVAKVQQVNANLVRAAGIQLGTKQISGAPSLQALEVGPSPPATLLHHGHAGSLRRVATDRRINSQLVFRQVTTARRQIGAADAPLAQLVGKAAMGGVMLRDQHQTRRIPIEPVNDSGPKHTPDSG